MVIRARAPLRLGLAGGGTDLSSFSDKYGGYVFNATIDRYVYATVMRNNASCVSFESGDREMNEKASLAFPLPLEGGFILHRAVYNHFIGTCNGGNPLPLHIHTLAEAPIGSGLGTSSTLVVSLCAAFLEFFNISLDEYQLAELAWKIERQECGFKGGKQDQYTAVFGGINFMEFLTTGNVIVNPLRIKRKIINEFEASLVLYFTGVSRESEKIIIEQEKNTYDTSSPAFDAMLKTKQIAYDMKAFLLTGDFRGICDAFRDAWEAKKGMANDISNSFIDNLYAIAMEAGAEAAKISGAGGGGFMMLLVPPSRRQSVVKILKKQGGEIFPAHFTQSGVEAWKGLFSAQR